MKYQFQSNTLKGAVAQAVAKPRPAPKRKSSAVIYAGRDHFANGTINTSVIRDQFYTITWDADTPAGEGGVYAIQIRSYDGHGYHEETFQYGGSWSFRARTTGEIAFSVGISRSFGINWGTFPVNVSID